MQPPHSPIAWTGSTALREIIGGPPAAQVACVAIGRRALLVVAERRAGRVFGPTDWWALTTLALQADAALDRIERRKRLSALEGVAVRCGGTR